MHFLLLLLSLTPLPLHRHSTCTHDVRSTPHCNKKERAIHTRSLFGLELSPKPISHYFCSSFHFFFSFLFFSPHSLFQKHSPHFFFLFLSLRKYKTRQKTGDTETVVSIADSSYNEVVKPAP